MGLFRKREPDIHVTAIVAAAGNGSRMEGIDKQLAELDDVPVLVHSILALSDCRAVKEVVVVCREEQIPDIYNLVREYDLEKVSTVIRGGDDRQQSVFAGVEAAGPGTEYFAIHDGARPLVSRRDIESCIEDAVRYGAAALGAPIKDTLKRADMEGFIGATVDREAIYAIYTPQIFEAELYRNGMEKAKYTGRIYSDDCQLMEACGHKVRITKGSSGNMKITTPEDLDLAESILLNREDD